MSNTNLIDVVQNARRAVDVALAEVMSAGANTDSIKEQFACSVVAGELTKSSHSLKAAEAMLSQHIAPMDNPE